MIISLFKKKLNSWRNFKSRFKQKYPRGGTLLDVVESLLVALFLALFIRQFFLQTSLVPTGSMISTLNIRDRLFVSKFDYWFSPPKRGDIVVFKSPQGDGKDYVKRCIGLPGETIEIIKGWVYVDGKLLILPGVNIQRDYFYQEPTMVPEDQYFVLGDNRGNSYDSRFWGGVSSDNFIGKARYTFWPFSRMRVLR